MKASWRAASGLVFGTLTSLVTVQCDRAPSEPIASAREKTKAARCLRRTPEIAPAPVAPGPDPSCPSDPAAFPPRLARTSLSFIDAPGTPALEAEIARTDADRERGLMYRRQMPENHGMIFVFGDNDIREFWMHNTCLPLDMLFVAEDGYVTGTLENVPTMNDDPRGVSCPVKYVIETNAGYLRRHGIKAGQTVKIPSL